jgi:hypothetical protein
VDRQLEEQDDNTCMAPDTSYVIHDLAPQQSCDTSEDSHVSAPRVDELPMRSMPHFSPFHTPMIAMSHEEISGMSYVMDETSVRVVHHGNVDPQIQEEVQNIQIVDPTHTHQHEEIESQLLETPLVEQIVETDRFMEHLLPRSTYMDEDALCSSQDDHRMTIARVSIHLLFTFY